MDKLIVYFIESCIAIIRPCDCGLTLEEIAKKDVPSGVKYKIIDESELPETRENRDFWKADFTEYDGIGGE